jgi:hypothetical protein
MLLTGSKDIASLRRAAIWREPTFNAQVDAFLSAEAFART